jgi:hypothetical protein
LNNPDIAKGEYDETSGLSKDNCVSNSNDTFLLALSSVVVVFGTIPTLLLVSSSCFDGNVIILSHMEDISCIIQLIRFD